MARRYNTIFAHDRDGIVTVRELSEQTGQDEKKIFAELEQCNRQIMMGGAEHCPFSPYSDVNVRDTSLREALHSRLFMKLQSSGTLMEDHAGGCVLYENLEQVEYYSKQVSGGSNHSETGKPGTVHD